MAIFPVFERVVAEGLNRVMKWLKTGNESRKNRRDRREPQRAQRTRSDLAEPSVLWGESLLCDVLAQGRTEIQGRTA